MSTITSILGSDQPKDSRTVINTNFSNLNSTKKEDSMSTNKILGRNTAWAGVIEEITLGTNLSMTGTTLNASWGGGVTIGTTTITSGTSWRILYDNAWVVGELATNGTGNVSLTTSPTFVTPILGAATATTINGSTIISGILNWTVTGTNTGDETTARINTLYGATVPTISSTNTITNKRNTKRVLVVTQSATPATNTDNGDIISITGIAQNITSMTTSITGTPVNWDMVMWQLTATGSFTLTWGASFASTTNANLPTAISTTMIRTLTQWNSVTSKWECIA